MKIPLLPKDIKEIPLNEQINDVFDYKSFIVNPNIINNDLEDFITGRIPQGFKSGIYDLDKHFVMKKNEFYILTGKKGQGKTTVNQALQMVYTIPNNLIFVVAFQENSYWSMKLNYMNYILCDFAKDVFKTNKPLFDLASKWVDEHFIFIKVEDIKTACEVTKNLIKQGKDIHALFLDPINSFKNGWQDSGNLYSDGTVAGLEILNFTKDFCSVHISQHPTMSGQRQQGAVNSYSAEGGWFLNKAHFTYVIHREKGTSENQLIIENVRNKHTGGEETAPDNPLVLNWSPTKIDLFYLQNIGASEVNIIKKVKMTYNPLNENFDGQTFKEIIRTINPKDAFDDDGIGF